MTLRQIASHHYRVLVVIQPVAGESVEAILRDAKRFYPLLFEQMAAALREHTPTFGPPFAEERVGVASAKYLDGGISELIALNRAASRRKGAKQSKEERRLGLRVFFFQHGKDVICTNACYKTSPTPPDTLPAAMQIRSEYLDYLASGRTPTIIEGD